MNLLINNKILEIKKENSEMREYIQQLHTEVENANRLRKKEKNEIMS